MASMKHPNPDELAKDILFLGIFILCLVFLASGLFGCACQSKNLKADLPAQNAEVRNKGFDFWKLELQIWMLPVTGLAALILWLPADQETEKKD